MEQEQIRRPRRTEEQQNIQDEAAQRQEQNRREAEARQAEQQAREARAGDLSAKLAAAQERINRLVADNAEDFVIRFIQTGGE